MGKKNIASDVWKRVRVGAPDECWPWTGHCLPFGYGVFSADGVRGQGAHRVAYAVKNGPIPEGMCVLHRCDNPPCCNPAHLFLGTLGDNNRDRQKKGRNAKQRDLPTGDDHWSHKRPEETTKGEQHGRAKLTEAQVVEMRELSAAGTSATDLMVRFGVTRPSVHLILKGLQWTHVGGPTTKREARAKMTEDDVRAIRAAFAAGEPRTPLATRYELDYATVTAIVTRRTWKHVT